MNGVILAGPLAVPLQHARGDEVELAYQKVNLSS